MATTTTPTYTPGAAGNVRSSSSLAASGTANYNIDLSAVFGGWITVLNTPGSSVSATRGLTINIFNRYGTTPTTAPSASIPYTLPSATASTAESTPRIPVETGYWNIAITNLDATNAVTVEITLDTLTNLSNG